MSSTSSSTSELSKEGASLFQTGFDIPGADLVLSSKEGHLFRVPSVTLRTASEFFNTTLTLPQGENKGSQIQVTINLDEPTRVVNTMLRIVCCIGLDTNIAVESFEDLSALLFAAEKY